jgi:hypothetical protein
MKRIPFMKKLLAAITFASVVVLRIASAESPSLAEPILLTSCGQSADVLMMKTLLAKDSLQFTYLPQATHADLTDVGSVMMVLGGSSKGLGAAKISETEETARVIALLDSAKAQGVPVLAVHMGGLNRRGALSDPFNRLGAASAARIIVVKGGNDDGFFTKIAAENSVPLDSVGNVLLVGPLVKAIYRPAAGE